MRWATILALVCLFPCFTLYARDYHTSLVSVSIPDHTVLATGSGQQDGSYVDDIDIPANTSLDDTSVVISPASITHSGITGTRLDQALTIHNHTDTSLTLAISESTVISSQSIAQATSQRLDFRPLISKLRHLRLLKPVSFPENAPLDYLTAATDPRGDNLLSGVDVLELLYQKRTTFLGPVLDLRVRLINPDSNLAGFISLDADQDFGTGIWPTPWRLGPRARDLGSEFEVLIDASGVIGDSLGFGNLPIAVIIRTADTSIVYIPLVPTITHDSVMTITVSGIPLGVLGLNDVDQNLNVGAAFVRLELSSAFPDYIPNIEHGLIGNETGVSWISTSTREITIPGEDSAVVSVSVLAAKSVGLYPASLKFISPGRQPINIPVHLDVTGTSTATINLSATGFSDTVVVGDSTLLVLSLSNSGNADLVWGILDTLNTAWLNASPAFGFVNPGSSTNIDIALFSAGLTPGSTYPTQVLIVSNDPTRSSIIFPISLRVEQLTSVDDSPPQLPRAFALYQNYPNPFNPETRVTFDLPMPAQVNLRVFDLLGREIVSLADGVYQPGKHNVQFDARRLSSGVYIYMLTADEFIKARKMVITR